MKAGIMEIPHIVVVNKADQKALALKTVNDLNSLGYIGQKLDTGWDIEVILTSALEGWGQEALVDAMVKHHQFLTANKMIETKRRQNRARWVYILFKERFGSFGVELLGGEENIFQFIEQLDTTNPFEGLDELTEKMWKIAGEDDHGQRV
jgi:LAO/AO transport system kinase